MSPQNDERRPAGGGAPVENRVILDAQQLARTWCVVEGLRRPQPGPIRRVWREPQRVLPLADFEVLDECQQAAWLRGDNWAAVGGVFVPHEGGVRMVSLAEAARWAA